VGRRRMFSLFFLVFCAWSLQHDAHRSRLVGDRSSSTAPAISMAPSIR
jgi:hypothetical protein